MKEIYLDDMIQGETYYIRTQNYKFKAVYDRYEKSYFHFKNIIRLNTHLDFTGRINIYEYFHFKIYEEQKTKIQSCMEDRSMNIIIEKLLGHSL